MLRKLSDYYLDLVKDSEVLNILLSHFGNGQGLSEAIERFHTQDGKTNLLVSYDDDGKIIGIEDDLSPEEFESLRKKIRENLIDNQVEKIGQVICFSHEKIKGVFRYKNLFQITPMPAGNPEVDFALANHPFILEVKYNSCSNFAINNTRKVEKAIPFIRFLSVLSRNGLLNAPRYTNHFWGVKIIDSNNFTSEWIQETYISKTPLGDLNDFTMGHQNIQLISSEEYYKHGLIRTTEDFVLPDSITINLDKIFSLPKDKFTKFNLACAWFSQSQLIWPHSSSAAYIAVVSALESLLPKSKEVCECCGQLKHAVTKRFKEFLKTYVPDIDQVPRERDLIYKTRSNIAHGGSLFLSDLEPWDYIFGSKRQNQDSLQRITYQISATAIMNWLSNPI